jgi:hypothetical protein
LFAEIGAMMMLMDRDEARKLLPKGVAYVERIIEQAGGVKAPEVQQETAPDGDTTPVQSEAAKGDDKTKPVLTKKFVSVFRPRKSAPKAENVEQILSKIAEKDGTEKYVLFARTLVKDISKAMNVRLASVPFSAKDQRPVGEVLVEQEARVLAIRSFKPLTIVDPATGQYDPVLLDFASMAVIDWLTTARPFGADRMDDLLKNLGLDWSDLDQKQIDNLINTIPVKTTSENLAKKVMKLWNVQGKAEAQMDDIRGITEGLVKDIFTVLSQRTEPLVKIVDVKLAEVSTNEDGTAIFASTSSLDVSALAAEQKDIGLAYTGLLDKVLFPEDSIMASFGENTLRIPTSPENKPDVSLTAMEQKAITNMQNIAHNPAVPVINFFKLLGDDAFGRMSGIKNESKLAGKHPLRLTISGKNASIRRDFETAFQMVDAAWCKQRWSSPDERYQSSEQQASESIDHAYLL